MAVTFTINNVDRTSLVRKDTLSISDVLNSRNSASFEMISISATYKPRIGQSVLIEDTDKLFAGTIDSYTEQNIKGTSTLVYSIDCVDYNQLCDRYVVAEIYENVSVGDIVKNIVDTALAGENVTYNNVENGVIITKAVFNYTSVSQAFDELSDLTGFDWYIDYDKDLHFFTRESNQAPTTLNEDNILNIIIEKTRNQYRNKQYVRAGKDVTDPRTDTFIGDGTVRSFVCNFALAETPVILVDSVVKTVGIRGIDTGKDWYWSKTEKEITQDDLATALTPSNTLEVTYKGFFPIVVVSEEGNAITDRAKVEGGRGVYESIVDDQAIESSETALEKADGLLRRFANIPETLNLETRETGFRAGQLLTVSSNKHSISGNYLIQSVNIRDFGRDGYLYTIVALSGENIGTWVNFFKNLSNAGRKYVIRENEVLVDLITANETISLLDSFSYEEADVGESRVGFALVGSGVVGFA